jgi:uncharacterized protein (DUF1015 family)
MADVRPFRGIRYNPAKVKNIGDVICPPHDIIPPPLQQELYHRSDYNFIRLEFGFETPQDNPENNRYTRAAHTMQQWLDEAVLKAESAPAVYLHDYVFQHQGQSYKRRGLVVVVRLEEWSKKVIFPHEGTLSKSKTDRLSLLWSCQANTSPILAMFEDNKRSLAALLEKEARHKPAIHADTGDGEGHTIWVLDEPAVTGAISRFFDSQPLYIADGHHRYESALTYKKERSECAQSTGEEPYNFVMMTLVDFADPGLLVLPPHRLVQGASRSNLHDLQRNLPSFFDIEEMPFNTPDLWPRIDAFLNSDTAAVRLVLYGLQPERLQLLQLREVETANALMPQFHTEMYKRLDVSVVDHVILEKLMGLGAANENAVLNYSHDKKGALQQVRDGEYQLAVLLSPMQASVIKAIADAGDRMPRKSTYFYPKEPAGLVFNRLV